MAMHIRPCLYTRLSCAGEKTPQSLLTVSRGPGTFKSTTPFLGHLRFSIVTLHPHQARVLHPTTDSVGPRGILSPETFRKNSRTGVSYFLLNADAPATVRLGTEKPTENWSSQ